MRQIEHLLCELEDALALCASLGDEQLFVTEARVDVPIEARFDSSGSLLASSPRGRMRTGFDVPHGRMKFQLSVREGLAREADPDASAALAREELP